MLPVGSTIRCDFVRIEIESALERNLPVVPILIDRAPMPGEADLPPSLAGLAYRNATRSGSGTGLPSQHQPAHQRD